MERARVEGLCYAQGMFIVTSAMFKFCAYFLFSLFLVLFSFASLGQVASKVVSEEALSVTEQGFKPYFLSLRFDETYMRSGPGRHYPAIWIYRRVGMPLEIVGQFDDWRKVRDFQGDSGWILSNQFRRGRSVIVTLPEVGLYKAPDTGSTKIARLGKDVVARVKRCAIDWCRVLVDKHDGWTRRGGLWGIREEELLP